MLSVDGSAGDPAFHLACRSCGHRGASRAQSNWLSNRRPSNCQSTGIWKTVMRGLQPPAEKVAAARPSLPFEVPEAAQILRMSPAQLYNRIHDGSLKPQMDGARTYITREELERYVQACAVSRYSGAS